MQRPGNVFEFGRNHHNHAAPVGGMVAAKIKSLVKQDAKQDVFRPASEVVNDVLLSELTDAPYPCLPALPVCRELLTVPARGYDRKTPRI